MRSVFAPFAFVAVLLPLGCSASTRAPANTAYVAAPLENGSPMHGNAAFQAEPSGGRVQPNGRQAEGAPPGASPFASDAHTLDVPGPKADVRDDRVTSRPFAFNGGAKVAAQGTAATPVGAPETELHDMRSALTVAVLRRLEQLDDQVGAAMSKANAGDMMTRNRAEADHRTYAQLRSEITARLATLEKVPQREFSERASEINHEIASCEGIVGDMTAATE